MNFVLFNCYSKWIKPKLKIQAKRNCWLEFNNTWITFLLLFEKNNINGISIENFMYFELKEIVEEKGLSQHYKQKLELVERLPLNL